MLSHSLRHKKSRYSADNPYALKRTGMLSHSLRHKKSRVFKRDFLWRREWDSNPRYACDVHTISNRAPSASSDISPRGFILLSCPFPSDACLLYDTFFVFASTFNIYSPCASALFSLNFRFIKNRSGKNRSFSFVKSHTTLYIVYPTMAFLSRPIDRPPIPFSRKIVTIFFRFDT